MKSFTKSFMIVIAFIMAGHFLIAQQQIQFEGLYAEGEGGAAWDADGSGPEPYGNGHENVYYYVASRDHVDATATSGAHITDVLNGFPLFEQALSDNGFTTEQVTLKIKLCDMGDDEQGIDWFTIGDMHYANFYPMICTFELDGELLIEAIGNYVMYISGTGTQGFESGYLKINNISGNSTGSVQNVANAILSDVGTDELQFEMQTSNAEGLSGNGRSGGYFDVTCTFEKGLPEIPFQGLNADHEGFAGWDADGTGPEPEADGHNTQLYYGASLDYDSIDPDPNACLGHFLEGQTGFFNTMLQLEYRGFEIGDLKMKYGLNSLGPDVEGEDWGNNWCNYYNNEFVIELNGESILYLLNDTLKLVSWASYWTDESSIGKVYDISENASPEAQFVAQSFLKDIGTHFLKIKTSEVQYVSGSNFTGNGRNGAFWEILEGSVVGVHEKATFIPEGIVEGIWTVDNSPYYIEGHLTIEDGQTLTIYPGVKVAVRGPYHFAVQGNIKALGASDNNIIFSSSNPNLYWDGFDFNATPATSNARFNHCLFQYGKAQGEGIYNAGGIFAVVYYDNITISNSTFRHNLADITGTYLPSGGAIALWNASPIIQKCIFYDNETYYGGALFSYANSNPVISNCLFYDNKANNGGAIAFFDHGQGILTNNTIVDNTALMGGGLYFYWSSNPEIINTILWGNEASSAGDQVFSDQLTSNPDFYYCDIEGGQAGFAGTTINGAYLFNSESNPMFSGDEFHPYSIENPQSICYNGGTPDSSLWFYPQYLPATCLLDTTRILFDRIDIGAYECPLPTGINENPLHASSTFEAWPNPFRNSTQIVFELAEAANVKIEIYNAIGTKTATLEDGFLLQGKHQTTLNHNLPEGIYFCRLQAGSEVIVKKIIKN